MARQHHIQGKTSLSTMSGYQPVAPSFEEMNNLNRDEYFWTYYFPNEQSRALAQTDYEIWLAGGIEDYLASLSTGEDDK